MVINFYKEGRKSCLLSYVAEGRDLSSMSRKDVNFINYFCNRNNCVYLPDSSPSGPIIIEAEFIQMPNMEDILHGKA